MLAIGSRTKIEAAGLTLERLTLSQSFRSTEPILDFVNAVIETTGAENFGITDIIEDHYSLKPAVGSVELLSRSSGRRFG